MTKTEEMRDLFGKRLTKLMNKKGISANKLAKLVGVDRASIGKYRKGEASPRTDTLLAICSSLEVQPNYFLDKNFSNNDINGKTDERKFIESLYYICKQGLIGKIDDYFGSDFKNVLCIYEGTLHDEILQQCLKYAGSEYFSDFEMCKKIADKYEPVLIEFNKQYEK